MVPVRLSVLAALLVILPSSSTAAGQVDNGQILSGLPLPAWLNSQLPPSLRPQDVAQWLPQEDPSMHSQEYLGLLGQQLGGSQTPYAQVLAGSPYSAQQAPSRSFAMLAGASGASGQDTASMGATIAALQTQLTTERLNEAQLASVAASRQEEMRRVNESFASILTFAEAGAEHEHQLQAQLANATAKNEALQVELGKARARESENDGEVSRLREEAREAEQDVKQGIFLQKRAANVMHDVQAAQDKVRRTEEIIRSLLPKLVPHLRVADDPDQNFPAGDLRQES